MNTVAILSELLCEQLEWLQEGTLTLALKYLYLKVEAKNVFLFKIIRSYSSDFFLKAFNFQDKVATFHWLSMYFK